MQLSIFSYLIDLTQCMRLKCNGQSIRSSEVVRRMIEARVYLEKLRPLDQKLRYQIDKLIRLATTGSSGLHQDPLQYKPNPENLVSKLHSKDDDEDDEEEEGGDVRSAVYVPPKMMAVPYEETGKRTREQKRDDVAKKRALSSSLLKEIRSEFQDGPEEISFHPAVTQTRNREKDKERERYEEDNFIRLNEKPTKKKRRLSDGADLGHLADFDDLTALTGERTPKRRKSAPSTRKKWKGRKGRKSR
ncbi:neuroguidin-like [Oscarella lobularis]|uniref:neuroguidin-like n=1 Tax=Oscarella lobularis TaxID=121494 RepID=UPI003313A567